MKSFLSRSIWLPAIITAALLLIALSLLVGMSWRSLQRLEPMRHQLDLVNHVQEAGLHLQQILVDTLTGNDELAPQQFQQVRAEVAYIIRMNPHLVAQDTARLRQLQYLLANVDDHPQLSLIASVDLMRRIMSAETGAHDLLLERIKRDTFIEFEIAAGIMILLPLLALLALFFLRHRILTPLTNLRVLMSALARQNYRAASTEGVDSMLLPLFDNYNHLVGRLTELEKSHQVRQQSLESEVRNATHTLLQQQRSLANAERLATVGEIAAGFAHELRNPLAGIQMALGNLRSELTDVEHAERLNMVIDELKRIARLLNDLLTQAHQEPEPPRDIQLAEVVNQVISLARYQLPQSIELKCNIPEHLGCRLPEGGLRQSLLNLILNSAEVIQESSGTIEISATATQQVLRLSVTDSGPGFPATLLEAGVRRFSTGRAQGTGLGLALVRRFASDLGGQLQLTNKEPHGACATLLLPCKETTHA